LVQGNFNCGYEFCYNFHSFKLEVSFSHDHFYTYRKKATFDIPLKNRKYEILHIPFILFSICSFAKTNKYDTFFRKGMEINRLPTKKQLLTTNFWQMISQL
jgi:hypothetical protein